MSDDLRTIVQRMLPYMEHQPRCLAVPHWPIAPGECSCGLIKLAAELDAICTRQDHRYYPTLQAWEDVCQTDLMHQPTFYARWLARERDLYELVQHHRPPSTPPMTREALEEAERQRRKNEA